MCFISSYLAVYLGELSVAFPLLNSTLSSVRRGPSSGVRGLSLEMLVLLVASSWWRLTDGDAELR